MHDRRGDRALEARDLRRLAARAVFEQRGPAHHTATGRRLRHRLLRRAPGCVRHGEVDVRPHAALPSEAASPLFQAALEATEEALYNALLRATTTSGRGRTVEAIPVGRVREILRKYRMADQGPDGPR
ncbi:MAG: P1 family peptidase [Singulisphaera sp.]